MSAFDDREMFKQFVKIHGEDYVDLSPSMYLFRSGGRASNSPIGKFIDPPGDELERTKLQLRFLEIRQPLVEMMFVKLRGECMTNRLASMADIEKLKELQSEVIKNRDELEHFNEVLEILGVNKSREAFERQRELEDKAHWQVAEAARLITI